MTLSESRTNAMILESLTMLYVAQEIKTATLPVVSDKWSWNSGLVRIFVLITILSFCFFSITYSRTDNTEWSKMGFTLFSADESHGFSPTISNQASFSYVLVFFWVVAIISSIFYGNKRKVLHSLSSANSKTNSSHSSEIKKKPKRNPKSIKPESSQIEENKSVQSQQEKKEISPRAQSRTRRFQVKDGENSPKQDDLATSQRVYSTESSTVPNRKKNKTKKENLASRTSRNQSPNSSASTNAKTDSNYRPHPIKEKKKNKLTKSNSQLRRNKEKQEQPGATLSIPTETSNLMKEQSRASRASSYPIKDQLSEKTQQEDFLMAVSIPAAEQGVNKSIRLASSETMRVLRTYSNAESQGEQVAKTNLFTFLKAIGMEIYFGLLSSKKYSFTQIMQMNEEEFDSSFELPLYAKERIWTGLRNLRSNLSQEPAFRQRRYSSIPSLAHRNKFLKVRNFASKESGSVNSGFSLESQKYSGVDASMVQLEALAQGMSNSVLD